MGIVECKNNPENLWKRKGEVQVERLTISKINKRIEDLKKDIKLLLNETIDAEPSDYLRGQLEQLEKVKTCFIPDGGGRRWGLR